MTTTEHLKPSGDPVVLGDVVLHTPGLDGVAELHGSGADADRGETVEGDYDEIFRTYLDEHAVVELRDVASAGAPPLEGGTRGQKQQVTVEGPEVGSGIEQLAVVQNEDGSVSWHFPVESQQKPEGLRGGGRRTFEIALETMPASPEKSDTRGPIGFFGRKILKIFGFRIAGEIGEGVARLWEKSKRPHRVREFKHDNIQIYKVGELTGPRWAELRSGPTLLFIHGTNSQIHSGFHALPPDDLRQLDQRYEGRVIGFDHPTVAFDPIENVKALMEKMQGEGDIEFDIVCHSRGGLVARELIEQMKEGSPLRVRKVIFVATPNAGTALADTQHIRSFLDTYTNFMSLIPSIGFVDILEVVINVAKDVALNIHGQLKGLQSMNPQGDYLKQRLNTGGQVPSKFSAIAADFEPMGRGGFPMWLRDHLFDEVFEHDDKPVQNDLVVPTEGVYAANRGGNFPINDVHSFQNTEAIHHSAFFDNRTVLAFLHERLQG